MISRHRQRQHAPSARTIDFPWPPRCAAFRANQRSAADRLPRSTVDRQIDPRDNSLPGFRVKRLPRAGRLAMLICSARVQRSPVDDYVITDSTGRDVGKLAWRAVIIQRGAKFPRDESRSLSFSRREEAGYPRNRYSR